MYNTGVNIIRKIACSIVLILLLAGSGNTQQVYEASWPSLNTRKAPEWYANAKFGIFIHWGLYSVPAWATNSYADGFGSNYAEWYWQRLNAPQLKIHKEFVAFHDSVYGKNFSYQEFAPRFTCEMFDPTLWASIIQQSGAKYVVLTSKHHDGFALWPSKYAANWNSGDIGPKKDLVGLLEKAIKQAGLRFGLYYSLYEWFNPIYKTDVNNYVANYMLPQIKELVTKYQPSVLWADGDWEHKDTVWKSTGLLSWLFNESAVKNDIVVNDRWGAAQQGTFNCTEYGKGNVAAGKPWEECRGIGESFGYNRNENLEQYATGESLVHQLIDVVSRGGNLLLNIGPTADGRIPVIMQQRLKEIGGWLQVNRVAIYNTHAWPLASDNKTDSTLKFTLGDNGKLYAIATKWKNNWQINGLKSVKKITMPGYNGKIQYLYKNGVLNITAPPLHPGNIPCNYAWVFEIEGK